MARVHILNQKSPNNFDAVTHLAMPAGTNSVGVLWKTCYMAWKQQETGAPPKSRLPIGNSAGQISQSESNQIASGDLIELDHDFSDDPSVTGAAKDALIDLFSNRAISDFQPWFAEKFKYYGYTRA